MISATYIKLRNIIFISSIVLPLAWPSWVQANTRISVEQGKAVLLPDTQATVTVFVAETEIADASVAEGSQIFVFGKEVGETTLFTSSGDGAAQRKYTIVVTQNLSSIRSSLSQRFPGSLISVSASRGSILVSGSVKTEQTRQRVIQTIEASVPSSAIIDQLAVSESNIVSLRVRLLEVNRSRANNYGVDWDATVASNGFFLGASNNGVIRLGKNDNAVDSLNASLDVLTTSGIISIAQETLLSTVTGEPAEFSVGGEIPIPAYISDSQDADTGNYQLDYKFIGTNLSFTPIAAPGEKLRLEIDSVISSADTTVTTVNGNTFPNLRSRAIRTSVELQDRQSFVIAGVSRNDSVVGLRNGRSRGMSRFVDTLFGTDRKSNLEQELVIVVTPLLSDEPPKDIRRGLPRSMSNLEFILTGGRDGGGKSPRTLSEAIRVAGFQY